MIAKGLLETSLADLMTDFPHVIILATETRATITKIPGTAYFKNMSKYCPISAMFGICNM